MSRLTLSPASKPLRSHRAGQEHKVFVRSMMWYIDGFDQSGAEPGKDSALPVQPAAGAAFPDRMPPATVPQRLRDRRK